MIKLSDIHFESDVEISSFSIDKSEGTISIDCKADVTVDMSGEYHYSFFNKIENVPLVLKHVVIDIYGTLDWDLEDLLTDEAFEFYEELYNFKNLVDNDYSDKLCKEVEEEDIDINKLAECVKGLYIRTIPKEGEYYRYSKSIILEDKYEWVKVLEFEVTDELLNEYLVDIYKNDNYKLIAVMDDVRVGFYETSKPEEAINDLKEEIQSQLDAGYEVDFDKCYIEEQEYDICVGYDGECEIYIDPWRESREKIYQATEEDFL